MMFSPPGVRPYLMQPKIETWKPELIKTFSFQNFI